MSKLVKRLPTPEALATGYVCSECGLAWSLHPEDASLLDCIRLLKEQPKQTISWSSPCSCWCHHQYTYTPYQIWSNGNDIQTLTVTSPALPLVTS